MAKPFPYPDLRKIMVTYNIDSDAAVGIVKSALTLTALFRSPGKVDYLMLYKIHGC